MTELPKKIADIASDSLRAIEVNQTSEDVGDLEQQKQAEAAAQGVLAQVDALAPETAEVKPDINAQIDAVLASPQAIESIEGAWSMLNVTKEAVLKAAKGPDFTFKNQQEESDFLTELKQALAERLKSQGLGLSKLGQRNLENNTSWDGVRPALLALKEAAIIDNSKEIDPNWPASARAAFEQALKAGVKIPAPLAKQLVKVIDDYNMEGTKAFEYNMQGPQAFEEDLIPLSGNPELKIQVLTQAIVTYLTQSPSLGLSDLQLRNELITLQKKDPRLEAGANGTYGEKAPDDLIRPMAAPSLRSQAAELTPEQEKDLEDKLSAAEKAAEAAAAKAAKKAIPVSEAESFTPANPVQVPAEATPSVPVESPSPTTVLPNFVPASPPTQKKKDGIELSKNDDPL